MQSRGLGHTGFSSCGFQSPERASGDAQLVVAHGLMWDLPGPGIEPVSPALAGRFFSTGPPEKPFPALLITSVSAIQRVPEADALDSTLGK